MENIVTHAVVYEKYNYDRFRINEALGILKNSDNKKKKNNNNLRSQLVSHPSKY